jgi:hypothetical protein
MSPEATPVQLDPRGRYTLPVVQGLQLLRAAKEGSPAQFSLDLENGATVILSMERLAVEAMREALQQYPEAPNWEPVGR